MFMNSKQKIVVVDSCLQSKENIILPLLSQKSCLLKHSLHLHQSYWEINNPRINASGRPVMHIILLIEQLGCVRHIAHIAAHIQAPSNVLSQPYGFSLTDYTNKTTF